MADQGSFFVPRMADYPFRMAQNPQAMVGSAAETRRFHKQGPATATEFEASDRPIKEPIVTNQALWFCGNTNDVPGGTGTQTGLIRYLDENMNGIYEETFSPNGLNGIATANTNMCYVEQFLIKTTGGGNAYIQLNTVQQIGGSSPDGTLYNITSHSEASSTDWFYNYGYQQAHHYVPNGKTCYITNINLYNKFPTVVPVFTLRLRYRPLGWPQYTDGIGTTFNWAGLKDGYEIGTWTIKENQSGEKIRLSTPIKVRGPGRLNLFIEQSGTVSGDYVGEFTFYDI